MTAREWVDQYAIDHDLELLVADGFDEAIVGVAQAFDRVFVVYDREAVLDILVDQGMDPEQAQEYFEFNMAGAYVGESTPAFLEFCPDLVEEEPHVH